MKLVPAAGASLVIVGSVIWYGLAAYANPYILVVLPISGGVWGVWLGLTRKERRATRLKCLEATSTQNLLLVAAIERAKVSKMLVKAKQLGIELCPKCGQLPKVGKPYTYWRAACKSCIFETGLADSRAEAEDAWNSKCKGYEK